MGAAACLAFTLALPTESAGTTYLPLPGCDIIWICKLYEKAIAGFYDVTLSAQGWRIETGKSIGSAIDQKSSGIDRILPSMRTDISLSHAVKGEQIIIDTKFNSIVTKGWYRDETLRSGYIYQIYAYLRSRKGGETLLQTKPLAFCCIPRLVACLMNQLVSKGRNSVFNGRFECRNRSDTPLIVAGFGGQS